MSEYDFIPGPEPTPIRPSPLRMGEIGASRDAFPDGLPSERALRWVANLLRRVLRRPIPPRA